MLVPPRTATPTGRRCITPLGETTSRRCRGFWNTALTGHESTNTAALPSKRPDTSITRKSSSCCLGNERGHAPAAPTISVRYLDELSSVDVTDALHSPQCSATLPWPCEA